MWKNIIRNILIGVALISGIILGIRHEGGVGCINYYDDI